MSITPVPTESPSHGPHVRENHGLLAAGERRLLVWIAQRLPAWVTSDRLTALGAVATLGSGLAFWSAASAPRGLALVPLFLLVNWFGDSLDGTLARVRRHERPRYGYYVDHMVDIAGSVVLMGGLAGSGLMSPAIAAVMLVCTLLLCAETFLSTLTLGVFRMSVSGVGPTELRILLAAGALRAMVAPSIELPLLGEVRLFDLGGVIGSAGMTMAFVRAAVRNRATLARLEPARLGAAASR